MKPLVRRFRRMSPFALDSMLAATFGIAGLIEYLTRISADQRSVLGAVAILGAYACLAFRRRAPLPAALAMFGLFIVTNLTLSDLQPLNVPLFAVLFMSYALGRYIERSLWAAVSLAALVASMITVIATMKDQGGTDFLFPTSFAVIAWVAGRAVRVRSQLTEELHEAAARAEEEHEAELARAAADERRRIAREMHDVVAHSVSVMVVQAGGARRILSRDPGRAIEAAANIEETGRAALVEMRRLLGMLGSGEEGARAPQPTLAELEALVRRSREAGLPVALTVEGVPRTLPAGIDLAAYRVLQEGLTNAMRHADGTQTDVTVRWADDALELLVADRGHGASAAAAAGGGGHGLIGMRERVRLYGGELWTGPRTGGGFEIRARIPLEAEVTAA
jgi:signal transduction histidine kinase